MNDPEVVALNYSVKVRDGVTFTNSSPVEHETPLLRTRLADGRLRAEPVGHYADIASARAAIEPFLRAWEMDAALDSQRRDFWFEYEEAEVRDRAPPPGAHVAAAVGVIRAKATATGTLSLTRATFPRPPRGFVATDLVRNLWDRYEASVDNREPAPSAGYYCYTALMALAPPGTKKGAQRPWVARELNIEVRILEALSELTNAGDHHSARKYSPKPRAHTGEETNWIRMAIRLIARRLGQWEFDRTAPLPPLRMVELPPLDAQS